MPGSTGDARIDRAPSARGAPLIPADHPVVGEDVGGFFGDMVETAVGDFRPLQELLDLVVRIAWAIIRVIHHPAPGRFALPAPFTMIDP
jgi:hypothetical protein